MTLTMRSGPKRPLPTALAGVAALALGLSGCGGGGSSDGGGDGEESESAEAFEDLSADEIMAEAERSTVSVRSMRIEGEFYSEADDEEYTLDGNLSPEGCELDMSLDDLTFEIIGVDDEYWVRGSEEFWIEALGESDGALYYATYGDLWLEADDGEEDFGEICDVKSFFSEDEDGSDEDPEYDKGDVTTYDGQDVIEIHTEDDDSSGTSYVLLEDPHYLIGFVSDDEDEPGEVTFSEFDEEFDVEAPDPDEVADL